MSDLDKLVEHIFGKPPGNPFTIDIELGEESFENLQEGETPVDVLNSFLTEVMITGVKYLYRNEADSEGNLNVFKIFEDESKFRLVKQYMASIGWVPVIEAGLDPETNEIRSYRFSYDVAKRM